MRSGAGRGGKGGKLRRTVIGYATATVTLAAAVGLRWLLDPLLGATQPLVTLYAAVAAAAWVGGYRPAIASALLGYSACSYLFIEPRGELGFDDVATAVGFAAYLLSCGLIIYFGEAMRQARFRASERGELLQVTLQSIGDAVITTGVDGRVTDLNAVAEELSGWRRHEAVAQPLAEVFRIVDEASRRPAESPAVRALREGTVVGLANHTLLLRRDGTEFPIEDSAAPIRDDAGLVSGCVVVFRDASAKRRAERGRAEQLHTARLLAAIVESSDDAIVSKSLDGVIRSWNYAAERLFGYTAEEAVGRHISLIIPPERIAEEDQIIAGLKAGRRVEHFETERLRKDGERIPISLTISPIRDDDGNVIGASKIARDVTPQRRAEIERRRAEAERERFVTLIESSRDFVGICDLEGIPLYVNRAGLDLVGLASLEEAGRTQVRDFFFPEDQDRILNELFPRVLATGHGEVEVRFRNFATGEARWMAYKVLRLCDVVGRPAAFGTVSQDVTERRRLEDDLRELAARLSEADRRKDEFLATLAHELRNPLAPLSNMLEVLKHTDGDAETQGRAREAMERQLAQLVRLVDDLLDLNRITHDRMELRRGPTELAPVIHQAVEASRPLVDSAGHELWVSLPAEPLALDADPARLTQVFANLLNNSCKYTAPGGKIWVSAERRGGEVVVKVRDTGIGIPPEEIDSVFEMFQQAGSQTGTQGGLGIGLTLAKRLVEMHGGAIEAKSEGEGKGSELVVRLPLLLDAHEPPAPRPAEPSEKPPARRILVVDDYSDSAASLAMLLEIAGNVTFTAGDGIEALEAFEEHRPEVVLLDIGLPKLSGHEVCRRLREHPRGKDVIVIALTGWGNEGDRRKSLEAGFDGHLVKPVDYNALTKLLRSLVSERVG